MYQHVPVLLNEVIDALQLHPGATIIDCTVGGGGHTKVILEHIGQEGRVLGIDRDEDAIDTVRNTLHDAIEEKCLTLAQGSFGDLDAIARAQGFDAVDGILFDLGASSHHFDTDSRGFSFAADGPLDMRYDRTSGRTAADILNTEKEEELANIFYKYGEERLSRSIARAIVAQRGARRIMRTSELADIADAVYRKYRVRDRHIHPATRVFQALRIAVNDEYGHLERALPQAVQLLKKGGRLVIITFHSGEDHCIKEFIRKESRECLCPKDFPVCVCKHTPTLSIVTKKGIHPSVAELTMNPRARSATLRVAERI